MQCTAQCEQMHALDCRIFSFGVPLVVFYATAHLDHIHRVQYIHIQRAHKRETSRLAAFAALR